MVKEQRERQRSENWVGRFLRANWHYLVVLVIGLILCTGVWTYIWQIMTGDDYAFHITRLQSASKGWANGQIVPQVDPDGLGGFGYAYNLFYGPLITYVAAAIQFVMQNFAIAINLVLVICLVGAGILMCYAMTKISRNRVIAALVAIFYMAAPYTLNNLYARMALGEVAAMVAVPILLLGLYQLTVRERHAARSIAVAAALLILSHSLSAMLFALAALIYVLFNIRKMLNWENIWRMILGVTVAVGLTAFFTLPLIEAKLHGNYGVFNKGYAEVYFGANPQSMNDHWLWPQQLLVMDYTGKVNAEGLGGEFGVTLGVIAIIGLIGFWFVRKRIEDDNQRRFVTSLYIIAVIAMVVALPVVNWYYMPGILWQMQFPWRTLMVSTALLAVVSGYTIYGIMRGLSEDKQRILTVVAGMMAVYLVMPLILPRSDRHIELEEVKEDPVVVGWEAEYSPMQLLCSADNAEEVKKGYACSLSKVPETLAQRGTEPRLVRGEAKITEFSKRGLMVDFWVENDSDEEVVIELPMIYYPGYQATVGGVEVEVRSSEKYGLAELTVPAGANGRVAVWYGLSRATKIGVMISVGTLGLGMVWLVIAKILEQRRQRKEAEMAKLMDSVREVMEKDEREVAQELMAVVEEMEEEEIELEDEEMLMKNVAEDVVEVEESEELKAEEKVSVGEEKKAKPRRATNKKAAAVKVAKTARTARVAKVTNDTAEATGTVKTVTRKSKKKSEKAEAQAGREVAEAGSEGAEVKNEEVKPKVTKLKAKPQARKDPE